MGKDRFDNEPDELAGLSIDPGFGTPGVLAVVAEVGDDVAGTLLVVAVARAGDGVLARSVEEVQEASIKRPPVAATAVSRRATS